MSEVRRFAAILAENQRLAKELEDDEIRIPNVPAIVHQAERFDNVAKIHAEEVLPRILELADSECGGSDEQLISELVQALKNFAEGEIAWREAGTETAELRIRAEAAEEEKRRVTRKLDATLEAQDDLWKDFKAAELKLGKMREAGELLYAAMLVMRCAADLREPPTPGECKKMGAAMKKWEAALAE